MWVVIKNKWDYNYSFRLLDRVGLNVPDQSKINLVSKIIFI